MKISLIVTTLSAVLAVNTAIDGSYVVVTKNPYQKNDLVNLYNGGVYVGNWQADPSVQWWDIDKSICYVSNQTKTKASPSLRSCYTTTD